MLRRGQTVAGRYCIERRIAQGGMGVVYAAEHLSTEERVALKVLWPHVLGSKAALENFQLEARIAARLGGEHIVRILDAGVDEALGLPYLAMELLRGQTLEAVVAERGRLGPAEAVWVMAQVARALDRAHGYVDRKGRLSPIVHRDLKPENLFLALPAGGRPTLKVLDFGVAKVLTQSQKSSQELRGTPLFMANEQIEGGVLTPQVDVWALGLIAYYMLTGRYYWRSASHPEGGLSPLFHEVLHRPIEAPGARARAQGLAPPWPAAFDAWFLRCVDRDPAARFASAGAAGEALSEALGVSEGRSLKGLEAAPAYAPSEPALPAAPAAPAAPVRATAAWAEAPRTGAAAGAAPPAGPRPGEQGATLVESVVQTVRPSRPSARGEPGRRPRGAAAGLGALALLMLFSLSVTYRYLSARPQRASTKVDVAAASAREPGPLPFAGVPGAGGAEAPALPSSEVGAPRETGGRGEAVGAGGHGETVGAGGRGAAGASAAASRARAERRGSKPRSSGSASKPASTPSENPYDYRGD